MEKRNVKVIPKLRKTAQELKPDELKNLKKRAIAGGLAIAAVLSLFVSSAVQNPADLAKGDDLFAEPAPIVEMVNDLPDDGSGGDDDDAIADEDRKRGGIRSAIRKFLLQRPLAVRVLICMPLWGIGWGISLLSTGLWSLLSPVMGTVMHLILTAAILLAIVVGTVKTIAPDVPIRKILSKKNICLTVLAASIFETALVLMQLFLPEGELITKLVKSLTTLTAVLAVTVPVTRKQLKKEKLKKEEKPAASE